MVLESFQPNSGIVTPIKSRLLSMPSPVLYFLNTLFDMLRTETHQANLNTLRTTKTAESNANFDFLQHNNHFH
jgi:hypothetical protein